MFTHVPQDKNYLNIVQQIKQAIVAGELKVGDQLPTENEFTKIFGVSRSSVREALKALEVMGMVESRKGGGSYIANNLFFSMADSLSIYFVLNGGTVKDLISMREVIELGVGKEIICNGTDEEIEELGKELDKYLNAKTVSERQKYDENFHHKMVSMSKNPLFIYILNALSLVYAKDVFDSHQVIEEHGLVEESFEMHRQIYNAIKERDIDKLTKAIGVHFDFSEYDLSLKVKYFYNQGK